MDQIGKYTITKAFSNENAGTAEWCVAEKDGREYFVKKFQKPVYPSVELDLSEAAFKKRAARYQRAEEHHKKLYGALQAQNAMGILVVPEEVISYSYHICAIADFVEGNLKPEQVHRLSDWQRLVLMRTLILGLSQVHAAGIVHGDMKPDNILIHQDPETGMTQLKLIDFDSGYFVEDTPKTSDLIMGDMAYWAPEIYAKHLDERICLNEKIDDFALGLILYYMWCGRLPEKPADKTVGQYLLEGGKISFEGGNFPPLMRKMLTGLLEADPEKRLPSAKAYRILDVPLKNTEPKIVVLVEPKKIEKKPEAKKRVSVPAATDSEKKPEHKEKPLSAGMVRVVCVDTAGEMIERHTVKAEGKSELVIRGERIDGYKLLDEAERTITFDHDGRPSTTSVTFVYKHKTHTWIPWLIFSLLVLGGLIFLSTGQM